MYKTNFIKEVILRIDYNTPISDLQSDALKRLKSMSIYQSSEFKEEIIKSLELKFEQEEQSFRMRTEGVRGTYSLDDGIHIFRIDNQAFSLNASKYTEFDTFFEIFRSGFNAFQEVFNVEEYKRIGLRFINRIEIDQLAGITSWKEYINPHLIPNYEHITLPENGFTLRRNMNDIILGNGEYFLRYRTGLWNKEFPSKIIDKEFIIDIDCYIDNVVLGRDDILNRPPFMSDITCNSFKFIATPELISLMEK